MQQEEIRALALVLAVKTFKDISPRPSDLIKIADNFAYFMWHGYPRFSDQESAGQAGKVS